MALTSSDTTKRTKCTQQNNAVPLPLPAHALIKIEDGNVNAHHPNHYQPTTTAYYEQEKSIQTVATAVQTPTEISGQLYYQHPGLIQIAPHPQPPMAHQSTTASTLSAIMDHVGHQSSPPPLQLTASTHSHSTGSISDTQLSLVPSATCHPEVQDANIQTSPVMSEDDNSTGHDGVTDNHMTAEYEEESQESQFEKPIIENEPEITREETKEHRESVPDTSVTSSSLIVIKHQIESPDNSINEARCNEATTQSEQEQKEPVDLSGLQLLSHSIDVFQKKIIKQEPQVRDFLFISLNFIRFLTKLLF